MADVKERTTETRSDKFVVDANYLREQAGEALRTFVAPLAGVYGAATGTGRGAKHQVCEPEKKRA